jgi:SAM-dependent methyltransferase
MPFSTRYFKKETIQYITDNFNTDSKILDIGAGSGTYSDYLKPLGYKNLDCVEVFKNYIDMFNLNSKYNKVINEDVTKLNLDFSEYDLIIIGDVLEHISEHDSKILLKKLTTSKVIVAVPFESPQGESYNNMFEIHLQDDLTLVNFFERFEGFNPYCLRFDYGVFINDKIDTIYTESNEFIMPEHYETFLNERYPEIKFKDINEI